MPKRTSGHALVPVPPARSGDAQTVPSMRGLPAHPGSTAPRASPFDRDSYTSVAVAEVFDRASHAWIAKLTMGLSPAALLGAYLDWLTHLGAAPGKRLQLVEKAVRKQLRMQRYVCHCAFHDDSDGPCIEPLPQDKRFVADAWQRWPFNIYYQAHLLTQQWWHVATTNVPGVSRQHERVLEFTARQILDVFAPSNYLLMNPEILDVTVREGGANLVRGYQHFLEDWERLSAGKPPAGAQTFRPGRDVAVTPGKVVYRNHLIELIQYTPSTSNVHPEPVLVVPAWIMKYYILDLSLHNSLVKHLVDQGFTVFMISWRNPGPEDRELSLDDYRLLGIHAALEAIAAIVPNQNVHGVGYCLGGTLLAIAAAAIARHGKSQFASLSFLAAQVDFSEPGELQLFINESQLSFLEDMMWEQGFLDARQMSGAFQMLRSNDLIWSRIMHEYLLGRRTPTNDLMAWNADSTRMPYRMHAQYLRQLYLNNELAEGRFIVDGRPITIGDIRNPIFCVGTVKDHVAPWRSVYKWNQLTDTDVTFVLTKGGHNAGIVSEPGHPGRSYQIATRIDRDLHIDPDTWAERTPAVEGSWWPSWISWLRARSHEPSSLPPLGALGNGSVILDDAPGSYIHMQ